MLKYSFALIIAMLLAVVSANAHENEVDHDADLHDLESFDHSHVGGGWLNLLNHVGDLDGDHEHVNSRYINEDHNAYAFTDDYFKQHKHVDCNSIDVDGNSPEGCPEFEVFTEPDPVEPVNVLKVSRIVYVSNDKKNVLRISLTAYTDDIILSHMTITVDSVKRYVFLMPPPLFTAEEWDINSTRSVNLISGQSDELGILILKVRAYTQGGKEYPETMVMDVDREGREAEDTIDMFNVGDFTISVNYPNGRDHATQEDFSVDGYRNGVDRAAPKMSKPERKLTTIWASLKVK